MASNNSRIYYAVHAVGFSPLNDQTNYLAASGVQSVGTTTTFNLEQVFQLGQLDIYENIENIPDIEATVEKVLDGSALIQHLATPSATVPSLAGRYNNQRGNMAIAYYNDENNNASGTPLSEVVMSGMYVSSIGFTLPVDGNFTESVTLVGNDKTWATGSAIGSNIYSFLPDFDDGGSPPATEGVQRRENLIMSGCKWPTEIPGVSSSGTNDIAGGQHAVHVQSVTINTDLGRTELFELGKRGPYHRFADFPTEVTCAIEVIETEFGDFINAASEGTNINDQTIYFLISDGSRMDLGTNNKLSSISSDGGDTGGGNRTSTYNYSNFNFLVVKSPTDPAGLT